MSDLYVCKKYETPYEEGYRVVRTIEEHNKIIYNQALEDMRKAILTDKELQFAPYSQEMWFKNRIMDIAGRLTK